MGDYDCTSATFQSCGLYDFTSNKWTMPTSMISKRTHVTAMYLPSLNTGGAEANITTCLYNPIRNSFVPDANTIQGHIEPSAVLFLSGFVLLSGDWSCSDYIFLRSAEVYGYRSNTWRSVADTNTARFRHKLIFLSHSFSCDCSQSMIRMLNQLNNKDFFSHTII
ncbi:unnamed protein product [Adineta ricciae]|nr:unnamed protein product [Adineta ricciae]